MAAVFHPLHALELDELANDLRPSTSANSGSASSASQASLSDCGRVLMPRAAISSRLRL
jgi:hypothetical protein